MILMRGTDPWGRGYPPGLRTQGRGFDSRWVRFNGREHAPCLCAFSYIHAFTREIWSVPDKTPTAGPGWFTGIHGYQPGTGAKLR